MSPSELVSILNEGNRLEDMGRRHCRARRYAEAEECYREAFALRQGLDTAQMRMTEQGLLNLASVYSETGKTAEAEALYLEAIALAQGASQSSGTALEMCLNNCAGFYRTQRRFAEAEGLIARMLAMPGEMLGSREASRAKKRLALARLLLEQGRWAEAEAVFRQSLETAEAAFGAEHPALGLFLSSYAFFLQKTGRENAARHQETRERAIREKYLREYKKETSECPPVLYLWHRDDG